MKMHKTHGEDLEFLEAIEHIERGEFKKAEQSLRRGLKRAQYEKDLNGVGFFYQALGFLYLLQRKKPEALRFYKRADNAAPDYYAKLAYARLLTTIFGDHDLGLQKATEALRLMPEGDQAASEAYSILGLCFLGIGDRDKALRAFAKSSTAYYHRLTPSEGYDLTLVTELIRRGVVDKRCVLYLARIKRKAGRESNDSLIKVVDGLLADATSGDSV